MTPHASNFFRDWILRFSAPPPLQTVAEWNIEHVVFDEPDVKGPFKITGRHYMIEPMNDSGNPEVDKVTLCFCTGGGKTIIFMGSTAWAILHKQPRCLWVIPAEKGAAGSANFANTRLIPMLAATKPTRAKWPKNRHAIGGTKVHMAGSIIDFAGGNSAGQLTGNRCSRVIIDEADKLPRKLGDEAGAIHQVITRTDGVVGAQIFISSSPSVEGGAIWESLMDSNCKRRFIPCPRCNPNADDPEKFFVMIWSKQFCVLPSKFPDGREIPCAVMKWDDAAKNRDGSWDMDKVSATARMICPFCGGAVEDADMDWCDEHGKWIATKATTKGGRHNGYHLPAFYAPRISPKASFGALSRLFLEAKNSTDGMGGFINSKLAEVNAAQEHAANKIEISPTPLAQPDWITLVTADFHKNWPFIWFVARRWCAFKLRPEFTVVDGAPDFMPELKREENRPALEICETLLGGRPAAWVALSQLLRFSNLKADSAINKFLISQKITGEKLLKFFNESGGVMEFRAAIHKEMGELCPKGGDSELVGAGNLSGSEMTVWDEFREVVKHFKAGEGLPTPNRGVGIDCGYAEKFNREVLRKCFESAAEYNFYDPTVGSVVPCITPERRHAYCLTNAADSWYALRGIPVNKPLGKSKINHEIGLSVGDPYYGSAESGTKVVETLEIPSGLFWLRKEDFKTKRARLNYSISPDVSLYPKITMPNGEPTRESNFKIEDYQKHLSEQYFDEKKGTVEPRHGRGGQQGRAHPYHLDDCEAYQIALATHHEFFQTETGSKE